MTFAYTLEVYGELLRARPGLALVIPGECAAFLHRGDVWAAPLDQSGRVQQDKAFALTLDAWDDDNEVWGCDIGGNETSDVLRDPRFVALHQ